MKPALVDVDATLAAVETAEHVIAVVNKYVPRAFGQAMIHSSKIDIFVQDDKPLMEAHFAQPNATEEAIGKHCAALIEDGAKRRSDECLTICNWKPLTASAFVNPWKKSTYCS